jgi:Flp pilus assembly protein TadD
MAGLLPSLPQSEGTVGVSPAKAALERAERLQQQGMKREALATLEKSSAAEDRAVLAHRGLLTLEMGRPADAEPLLRKALDPTKPDWRLLSGLGAATAAQGRQKEAHDHLTKALALAPGQPAVLNNLALVKILDGNLEAGEKLLRQVGKSKTTAGDDRATHNLALAVGLRSEGAKPARIARPARTPRAPVADQAALAAKAPPKVEVTDPAAWAPPPAVTARAEGTSAPLSKNRPESPFARQ